MKETEILNEIDCCSLIVGRKRRRRDVSTGNGWEFYRKAHVAVFTAWFVLRHC